MHFQRTSCDDKSWTINTLSHRIHWTQTLHIYRILMCWQSHSPNFISILGVLDCSNEINSWQFLCNLMKTCSLLVWKKNRNHNNDVSTSIYIIVCGSESASWIQITILVNMCLEHISICQWEKKVFWQSIVT